MNARRIPQGLLRTAYLLCAVAMVIIGGVVSRGGYRVALQWREVSGFYAAVAVLWIVAGAVMLTAALGIFLSGGRQRMPVRAGSVAAAVAGASLIAGVLTYVVPCAGPT